MYKFSKRSLANLANVDQRLVDICYKVLERRDFTVICGHRGKEEQDQAVREGKSKTPYPKSKHNSIPARAIDVIPYPFSNAYWNDKEVWKSLAEEFFCAANELGISIRWGGDWNQNGDYKDEKFFDGPHIELIGE